MPTERWLERLALRLVDAEPERSVTRFLRSAERSLMRVARSDERWLERLEELYPSVRPLLRLGVLARLLRSAMRERP